MRLVFGVKIGVSFKGLTPELESGGLKLLAQRTEGVGPKSWSWRKTDLNIEELRGHIEIVHNQLMYKYCKSIFHKF